MKQSHFWHFALNSRKLKVDPKCSGWAWSRMGVANLANLDCISRMNRKN